jgi:phenylpropionate dioxygenase-like ring-hydroxylating dioxygenase large terminal subunit
MHSMLPGAPWLLAHKSMLKVNQPRKISLYGMDYVMWKDATGAVYALPNACPHMGAMLSEGWCEVQKDGTTTIVCPFHALPFDAAGCTVLPGSHKKTLPQLKPLELVIQEEFIWSYGGHEPKIPIPTVFNEIAKDYYLIGHVGDRSVETDLLTMLLNMHDYNICMTTIIRTGRIVICFASPRLSFTNSLTADIIPTPIMISPQHPTP